ncbi:MAG: hypothetical protein ABI629_10875 [bacterium]
MPRLGPAKRTAIGGAVLAADEIVDTTPVRAQLARFAAVHRRFADAQRAVAAADARVEAARLEFNTADRALAGRTAALAGALTVAGQPRVNPFRAYAVLPPAALARLAVAAEARTVHRLVATVRHAHPGTPLVLERAAAADSAAADAESALAALRAAQTTAHAARRIRDVIGRQWDKSLAALNYAARAAALSDGAVDLHAALFHA